MGRTNARVTRPELLNIRRGGVRSAGLDRQYDELRPQTRLVIGLLQSTELTKRQIAEIVRMEYSPLLAFIRSLRGDPFTAKLLRDGLPGAYGESLPPGVIVKCFYCGVSIRSVPCVACWPCLDVQNGSLRAIDTVLPEGPGVNMKPGSWEKIEVMADRVSRELSPFSSGDTWSPDCEDDEAFAAFTAAERERMPEADWPEPSADELYEEFRRKTIRC